MLQDTDFFDKLAQFSTVGEDVPVTIEWEESPSADERYSITMQWRFRKEKVGEAYYVIEPIFGTDELRLFWINLEFIEDWQDKGLYSTLVKNYKADLPRYGITEVVTVLGTKESERRLASQGFAWVGDQFVLDLTAPA
jgi:hypothetical protein